MPLLFTPNSRYYFGYLEEEKLFAVSSAARRGVKSTEYTYVRVEQGCLLLDSLVNPTQYRIRHAYQVKLPVGSSNYWRYHLSTGEEDLALTRAIFGATLCPYRIKWTNH